MKLLITFALSALATSFGAAVKTTLAPSTTSAQPTNTGTYPIPSTILIQAQDFTSAVNGVDYKADAAFPRASEANFCASLTNPGQYYWCFNGPFNVTIPSSLTFDINIPAAVVTRGGVPVPATWHLGFVYSSTDPPLRVKIVDESGFESFGPSVTPATTGPNALVPTPSGYGIAVNRRAAQYQPGVHTLTIGVTKGNPTICQVVLSALPIPGNTVLSGPSFNGVPFIGQTILYNPATLYTAATGTPSTLASTPGVPNVCGGCWCETRPVPTPQTGYITYDVTIAETGVYYFGVTYSNYLLESQLKVYVDNVEVFGNVLTPITGGWTVFGQTSGSTGALLTAGNHVVKLSVIVGRVPISSFFLTGIAPAQYGASNKATLPAGGMEVLATTFMSAVSSSNFQALQTFPRANLANFCSLLSNPADLIWCWNAPTGVSQGEPVYSSLTFSVIVPSTATYYFGLNYGTGKWAASMTVTVDGKEVFGSLPVPNTSGVQIICTSTAQNSAILTAGNHTIVLTDLNYNIGVLSFYLSPTPIENTFPTNLVPPTAVPTAPIQPLGSLDPIFAEYIGSPSTQAMATLAAIGFIVLFLTRA